MQLLNIRQTSRLDNTLQQPFTFLISIWLLTLKVAATWETLFLGQGGGDDYLVLPGHFTKHVESTMQQIAYRLTIIDAAGA